MLKKLKLVEDGVLDECVGAYQDKRRMATFCRLWDGPWDYISPNTKDLMWLIHYLLIDKARLGAEVSELRDNGGSTAGLPLLLDVNWMARRYSGRIESEELTDADIIVDHDLGLDLDW
jgi:hypothetical protein